VSGKAIDEDMIFSFGCWTAIYLQRKKREERGWVC